MDNQIWNQILDLPVILQGALGSLLFWIGYEILRRTINLGLTIISKINVKTKNELQSYKALHHAHCALEVGSGPYLSAHLASVYTALNRFIQAIIYVCLGLLSHAFIGDFSIIAYLIAIYYLFLALRSVQCDREPSGMSKKEHAEEFMKVVSTISETKTDKNS